MIRIEVLLENDFDSKWETVTITKQEIQDYACAMAKEKYENNHWTSSMASDEILIKIYSK